MTDQIDNTLARHRWCGGAPRTFTAVIVHGYGEHARRYDHVAKALVAAGADVYAYDHRGHGESEGERASVRDMEDLVDDTAQVVKQARSGLPVVMLGHSLGGIIATRYAQRPDHGLSALVLSGPVIGGNPDLLGLVNLPEIPDIPIDPAILSRDSEVGRAYAEDPLVYHGPFKRETLQAIIDSIDAIAGGGDLGELPTLWIHGDQDMLAPIAHARPAVERIRGSVFEERIYEGAQHEVLNEINRDEVIADVLEFLQRTLGQHAEKRSFTSAR
jgi:alpha-beta hydrolase superfamily lysophospholipase